jgi:hypothetical protein
LGPGGRRRPSQARVFFRLCGDVVVGEAAIGGRVGPVFSTTAVVIGLRVGRRAGCCRTRRGTGRTLLSISSAAGATPPLPRRLTIAARSGACGARCRVSRVGAAGAGTGWLAGARLAVTAVGFATTGGGVRRRRGPRLLVRLVGETVYI